MAEAQKVIFTLKEFMDGIDPPLITVNLGKPVPAFVLQKYHKKLRRAIAAKCKVFIGKAFGRPKLPLENKMASIGFQFDHGRIARVCFRLPDMYCTGVWIDDGNYYEARSATSSTITVANSVPLGRGVNYKELLGYKDEKPELSLSYECLCNAYWEFLKLGTPRADKDKVLLGIGMTALIFMEPCRQAEMQEVVVGAPGRYRSLTDYAVLRCGEGTEWNIIHTWKKNCLLAEGLRCQKGGVLVVSEDQSKTLRAQETVYIILSNEFVHQM